NPFNIDTDLDGITDTLEIDGFVFTNTMNIPHTFYSNPHEFDTNRDGLNDNLEWPFPIGDAPSIDPDGDDLPNLWDSDNDNDGITDGSDMDPYTVTAYQPHFSIQTSLNGSTYNGHQYIEFQVQPQDESHLRLVTTELDWPYDDKGSLQAQDVTNQEEMTFVPLLKVVTNNVPSQELQQMYGVSVVNQGSSHIMYLDLQPIGDGGKIAAFQGKVAYGPGDLADINWSKVELVWMVMMKSTPPGATDPTDYETVPVAEYAEPNFRFAGLEVTKSGTTKYGIIGTPAAQTDHRQLANLVMGLEGSFLATAVPDFDTIVGRLSTPTTPLTQTWGIPVNDIAVGLPPTQPTHMDAALQQPNDTYSTISTFLTDNSYNTSEMASVIMALEAEAGRDSLDGDAVIAGNTLTFNLANIPVAQTRSLTLSHYQYVNNQWDDMDDTEAINTLISSYDNDPDVVLADLQQLYPELTDVDLANLLSAFYLLWLHGQNTLISIDGVYVVEETEENTLINDQINLPSVTDTLTYIIEANNLGVAGKSLVFNDPQSYQQYQDATLTMPGNLGLRLASNTYTLLMRGWQTFSLIVWNGKLGFRSIQYSANGMHKAGQWLFGANKVSSYTTLGGTKITKVLPQKAGLLGKWHKVSGWVSKHSRLFTKIGLVLRVAAFIFTVVMIWVNYANFSSPYSFEEEYAAIYASLDTLFTTISFILAFTGFGAIIILIFFIFDMIGLIITAIAGTPVDSIVTTAITKFFADFRQYSKVGGLAFNGISSSINGSGYQVAGNTLTLADIFEGEIDGYTNHMDKLLDSDIVGYFNARAGSNVSVSTTDNRNYPYRCQVGGSILFCRNWLKANYQFNQAGRDQKIEFLYKVKAVTQFAQYSFFGTIRTDREDVMYLPDELDAKDRWQWVPVYIDVLPDTLDGLLNWGELINHDPDGDDIVTTIEDDIVNTDIDGDGAFNWQDWDRDGDDLADKFEEASNTSLGTNANIQDTDGDTLDDGLELMLGTGINQVDSDNDGLNDNVEQFHWNGSAWAGGGWFIDINGQNYWVFSDPTANDRDLDGLNDSSEQLNGTSPNAFNAAPQLELAAEPLTTSPDDFTGIYVKNGDPVTSTLRLFNTGSSV
ncbi:MAG: hypothetical protein KDE48_00125, partial [Anaerolineales bacterium]|nr:hypothetical protein [Anaerolineales bacterium]